MKTLREPPAVSGGDTEHGHLEELRTDPIRLMNRVRSECGNVGRFQLADRTVVLLSGAEANEFFFRSADEDLDQGEAYPFMKPIFGAGVVFDASPERRKEMLHNAALRGEQMKGHATTIAAEVDRMVADWGDEGEIDLLDFFAELTIYTTSSCLIGPKFREELDGRFAKVRGRGGRCGDRGDRVAGELRFPGQHDLVGDLAAEAGQVRDVVRGDEHDVVAEQAGAETRHRAGRNGGPDDPQVPLAGDAGVHRVPDARGDPRVDAHRRGAGPGAGAGGHAATAIRARRTSTATTRRR